MKLKSTLRWSEKGQNIRRCAMAKIASSFAVSMFVKAEGPSGRAKIRSDDPKQALGLAQYLRTIGYNALQTADIAQRLMRGRRTASGGFLVMRPNRHF
jgi:hypothetical protein